MPWKSGKLYDFSDNLTCRHEHGDSLYVFDFQAAFDSIEQNISLIKFYYQGSCNYIAYKFQKSSKYSDDEFIFWEWRTCLHLFAFSSISLHCGSASFKSFKVEDNGRFIIPVHIMATDDVATQRAGAAVVMALTYVSRNGPLTRYSKLRVAHAPGMPGTFSPPPGVSDPDMHHSTCLHTCRDACRDR